MSIAQGYLDTLRVLWPEGLPPRLVDSRAPLTGELAFLVVPSPDRVRMLVPADNAAAAARAMLRFSAAIPAHQRVGRLSAAAGLRVAGRWLLRHRIDVASNHGSLVAELASAFGHGLHTSLSMGPARSNRKPVLELFDADGRTVAFAKVGYSSAVRRNVVIEREALRTLAAARLPDPFEVPRVLMDRRWSDMPVLVMSSLQTPALARRLRDTAVPVREMELLSRTFREEPRPLTELPMWRSLLARRTQVRDARLRQLFTEATDRLTDRVSAVPLQIGAWHGDWTPWNMSWRRGRLQLWDWERFATGVPLGLDRVHYGVNTAFLRHGVTPEALRRGLAVVGLDRTAPGESDHVVVSCYHALMLDRYLMEELPPRGAVAQRVEVSLADLIGRVS